MAIERFIVSNDTSIYESWPCLALTLGGALFCVFTESTSHGDRSYSRVVYTTSTDRGRTWSAKVGLTEPWQSDGSSHWDCARVTRLKDGRLAIVCNFSFRQEKAVIGDIYLWIGDAEGKKFSEGRNLGLKGIVPDKLLELESGRWIIACHGGGFDGFMNLQQRLYYSDDQGETWSDPVTVAKDERYNLCEASILEVSPSKLVCFMRENSSMGYECFATMSEDAGESWGPLYLIPLAGCHRPVAGFLDTGEIMITYRYRTGAQKGWLGKWTQNTFLALTDVETVCTADRRQQEVRIMPLNYDTSAESDLGYTGWVQFPDGEIYIVDYIRNDQPKCYIIGASLRREDIGGLA